jgi:hypothetical protein
VIIAKRNRPDPLTGCLRSIEKQTAIPGEAIVVDASDDDLTHALVESIRRDLPYRLLYLKAESRSAPQQA